MTLMNHFTYSDLLVQDIGGSQYVITYNAG
jgi:hypothetical protein